MAKPVTFLFSAAGVQQWEVPADGIITGFLSGIAGAGLTTNPSAIATDFSAPPTTKLDNSVIVNSGAGFVPLFHGVSRGEIIFANARAVGTTQLFFDDLS